MNRPAKAVVVAHSEVVAAYHLDTEIQRPLDRSVSPGVPRKDKRRWTRAETAPDLRQAKIKRMVVQRQMRNDGRRRWPKFAIPAYLLITVVGLGPAESVRMHVCISVEFDFACSGCAKILNAFIF